MPGPLAAVGMTVVMQTSTFALKIVDIPTLTDRQREDLDTSHQGTTGARTFIGSDLVDNGELVLECQLDPDYAPPLDQPNENITVTHPLFTAGGTAATWVFAGYMKGYSPSGELDGILTVTVTFKVADDIATTAES